MGARYFKTVIRDQLISSSHYALGDVIPCLDSHMMQL